MSLYTRIVGTKFENLRCPGCSSVLEIKSASDLDALCCVYCETVLLTREQAEKGVSLREAIERHKRGPQ